MLQTEVVQTGFLMAFLIMTSSFHVHIHVPESSLTHFCLQQSAWKNGCVHSRTSLSPVGESSAEQEEPPETWGDAVEREEVLWGISSWLPPLKEDQIGVFQERWASL